MDDKQYQTIIKKQKDLEEYLFIAKWTIVIAVVGFSWLIMSHIDKRFQELQDQIQANVPQKFIHTDKES